MANLQLARLGRTGPIADLTTYTYTASGHRTCWDDHSQLTSCKLARDQVQRSQEPMRGICMLALSGSQNAQLIASQGLAGAHLVCLQNLHNMLKASTISTDGGVNLRANDAYVAASGQSRCWPAGQLRRQGCCKRTQVSFLHDERLCQPTTQKGAAWAVRVVPPAQRAVLPGAGCSCVDTPCPCPPVAGAALGRAWQPCGMLPYCSSPICPGARL